MRVCVCVVFVLELFSGNYRNRRILPVFGFFPVFVFVFFWLKIVQKKQVLPKKEVGRKDFFVFVFTEKKKEFFVFFLWSD